MRVSSLRKPLTQEQRQRVARRIDALYTVIAMLEQLREVCREDDDLPEVAKCNMQLRRFREQRERLIGLMEW